MSVNYSSLDRAIVGTGQSAAVALTLLWLLHRAMAGTFASPQILFIDAAPDLLELVWTWPYLAGVLAACAASVAKRDHAMLIRSQWYALGCGLLLMLYGLGGEVGDHVDPRYLYALLCAVAALYSCYACIIGHCAIAGIARARGIAHNAP